MAIQLFNILATSVIVVLSLRIFARYFADSRIAAFGAAYILVATPITFWAVSAKDHTASVLLIVASIWSLYTYLLDGKTRYRYLSYVLVGLSFWVRVFDAIPLLIAIVLTDLLTSEGRIKALITAAVTVTLAMIPYIINNYLLFGNPFLSPVYLSAHQEIAQQTSIAAGNASSALFATIERLPALFFSEWNVQNSANWPQHLYHVLFYVNMPVTLSVFQICPILTIRMFSACVHNVIRSKDQCLDQLIEFPVYRDHRSHHRSPHGSLCAVLRWLQERTKRACDLGRICHVCLFILADFCVLGVAKDPYRCPPAWDDAPYDGDYPSHYHGGDCIIS